MTPKSLRDAAFGGTLSSDLFATLRIRGRQHGQRVVE
jgi:hypothetical protein